MLISVRRIRTSNRPVGSKGTAQGRFLKGPICRVRYPSDLCLIKKNHEVKMTELNSGILVIGVSSTVLFDGETATTELILLNLATGVDFSLPVTEDQAQHVMAHLEPMVQEGSEDEAVSANRVPLASENPGAEAFAKKIGVGGTHASTSPEGPDQTPQF